MHHLMSISFYYAIINSFYTLRKIHRFINVSNISTLIVILCYIYIIWNGINSFYTEHKIQSSMNISNISKLLLILCNVFFKMVSIVFLKCIHSGHNWVDFESCISSRLKVESCVYIDFYIIIKVKFDLNLVSGSKSNLIT